MARRKGVRSVPANSTGGSDHGDTSLLWSDSASEGESAVADRAQLVQTPQGNAFSPSGPARSLSTPHIQARYSLRSTDRPLSRPGFSAPSRTRGRKRRASDTSPERSPRFPPEHGHSSAAAQESELFDIGSSSEQVLAPDEDALGTLRALEHRLRHADGRIPSSTITAIRTAWRALQTEERQSAHSDMDQRLRLPITDEGLLMAIHRLESSESSKQAQNLFSRQDDRVLLPSSTAAAVFYTDRNLNGELATAANYSSPGPLRPPASKSAERNTRYLLMAAKKQSKPTDTMLGLQPQEWELDDATIVRKSSTDNCGSSIDEGRPVWGIPVEVMELIAHHLDRDDVESLRLVNRELNHTVSSVLFKTVVVPFNTEIYGMLDQDFLPDFKGKGRAKHAHNSQSEYLWRNSNSDGLYNGHGIDVFRGFGSHIVRFGMSFEVTEESLYCPPTKVMTEPKTSFWGIYDWPFAQYCRYDHVAGLEHAADETPRMTTAFSELKRVKELALSVDSGLGWLNGPDQSIRAQILRQSPAVFGTLTTVPDRRIKARVELWRHFQACHEKHEMDIRQASLYKLEDHASLGRFGRAAAHRGDLRCLDRQILRNASTCGPRINVVPDTDTDDEDDVDPTPRSMVEPYSEDTGILFTATSLSSPSVHNGQVIPRRLTRAQKEWLLETEWAQRAFLSSYMLAVIDNHSAFQAIHTLTFARISDRYLPLLNRNDFWDALPGLKAITLLVIPGFRDVLKDEAGVVDTPAVNPVEAADTLFAVVQTQVSSRSNVETLTVGWATGGEHAEGIYARNKLILPAPLLSKYHGWQQRMDIDGHLGDISLLSLPHVRNLTLQNCWIAPPTLARFVKHHDALVLERLTFNSVSLSAVVQETSLATAAAMSNSDSLKARPHDGSWTHVIDLISPGLTLSDFGSSYSSTDTNRQTALRSITFSSCGYVKLPWSAHDQSNLPSNPLFIPHSFFVKLRDSYSGAVLEHKFDHLGEIVQAFRPTELDALQRGWNMTIGWDDIEKAGAAEFDGLLAGGTGRFSGSISRDDQLRDDQPSSSI